MERFLAKETEKAILKNEYWRGFK